MIKVVLYFFLVMPNGEVVYGTEGNGYPQRNFESVEECRANARQYDFMRRIGDIANVYMKCEEVKEVAI